MEDFVYFWINDTELLVNDVRMTPEVACERYPEHKKEIQEFVAERKNPRARISHAFTMLPNRPPYIYTLKRESGAMHIEKILVRIREEIAHIFKECGIDPKKNYNDAEKYRNAFMLFKYVVENAKYDINIMNEKQEDTKDIYILIAKDIYRCLCEHRCVCSSDAAALSLLFEQAGIPSRHLTIAEIGEEPIGAHEVVSFDIAGKTMLCSPTEVRTALEKGIIPDVHPSVFAFTPNDFFSKLYPTKEVKFEHKSFKL